MNLFKKIRLLLLFFSNFMLLACPMERYCTGLEELEELEEKGFIDILIENLSNIIIDDDSMKLFEKGLEEQDFLSVEKFIKKNIDLGEIHKFDFHNVVSKLKNLNTESKSMLLQYISSVLSKLYQLIMCHHKICLKKGQYCSDIRVKDSIYFGAECLFYLLSIPIVSLYFLKVALAFLTTLNMPHNSLFFFEMTQKHSYRGIWFLMWVSMFVTIAFFSIDSCLKPWHNKKIYISQRTKTFDLLLSHIEFFEKLKYKISEDKEEDLASCVICHELLKGNVVITPCIHLFHEDCFVQWLQEKAICPLCKNSSPIENCLKIKK